MTRSAQGFTLIELMIVVVIIGILAAIAIPNFLALQTRAKEGSTKSNMHSFQLAAEDYGAQNMGLYPPSADVAAGGLPSGGANFTNPFDGTANWYADQPTWTRPLLSVSTTPGITVYGDSLSTLYQIVGQGKTGTMPLVLTSN